MAAKHRHHIVPRFAGGPDSLENMTPAISIRLHAMFHFDRWRQLRDVRDYAAYRMLLGQLSGAEARYLAISELLRGRKFSPETLAKMSAAQRRRIAEGRGAKQTPESLQRLSAYRKGRRDLIAAALAKSRLIDRRLAWSDEMREAARARMLQRWSEHGETMRANVRPIVFTPEVRQRMSAALKGRVFTAQHRERIANARRARPLKTHCPKGHPYDAANLCLELDGTRRCRICRRESLEARERRQLLAELSENAYSDACAEAVYAQYVSGDRGTSATELW